MVASDRISAYDVVLPTPIPDKGKVLTQLSVFWFGRTGQIVPNHLVSTDVPDEVEGRAIIVRKLDVFPVECVVRGYPLRLGVARIQREQFGLRDLPAAGAARVGPSARANLHARDEG